LKECPTLKLDQLDPNVESNNRWFFTTTAVAFGISELTDAEEKIVVCHHHHYCRANQMLFSVDARLEVLTEVQARSLMPYLSVNNGI